MAIEQTLSIIKPDAVQKNLIGEVLCRLEKTGLHVIASKMVHLTRKRAESFYAVHSARSFYGDLVAFISSGPVLVSVLEGENAILKHREIMGATDPKEAAPGTIRADFAESIERNVIHGSDGPDTARFEIDFFFQPEEIYSGFYKKPL